VQHGLVLRVPDNGLRPGVAAVLGIAAGGAAVAVVNANETAILTFAGVLIVAIITAVTADRRQDKQLNAEHERHGDLLQAERDRLDARLIHERKLADVEHLRQLLDDAAPAYESARVALLEFAVSLATSVERPGRSQLIDRNYTEAVGRRTAAEVELHRLEMRLHSDHPVCSEYKRTCNLLRTRSFRLGDVVRGRDPALLQGDNNFTDLRLGREAADAFSRFTSAARDEIGAAVAAAESSASSG
jgi:hypothetical protein